VPGLHQTLWVPKYIARHTYTVSLLQIHTDGILTRIKGQTYSIYFSSTLIRTPTIYSLKMAILPSLPGISVTVHNAKGQLPEYADAEPDVVKNLRSPSSVVVSNYIEAPPDGGPFWPKFRVDAPYTHGPHRIYFMVNIPGVDIRRGMSCGPSDVKEERSWENVLEGYDDIDERGPVYRNFQFTKLKILSDDGQSDGLSEKQNSQVAGIGTLQVRVLLGERGKMFEPGKHGKSIRCSGIFTPSKIATSNKTSIILTNSIKGKPTIPILTEKIAEKKCLSLAVGQDILVFCRIYMLIV
jgi:hypothetical protein